MAPPSTSIGLGRCNASVNIIDPTFRVVDIITVFAAQLGNAEYALPSAGGYVFVGCVAKPSGVESALRPWTLDVGKVPLHAAWLSIPI